MRDFWLRLFRTGITADMTYSYQRRITLTNMLGFTMVISMLLMAVMFSVVIEREIISIGAAGCALIFSLVPWLNSKKHYNISRLTLTTVFPLVTFGFSLLDKSLDPSNLGIDQYFIPRILIMSAYCIPFVLFGSGELKSLIFTCALTFCLLIGFDDLHEWAGFGFYQHVEAMDLYTYGNINYVFFVGTFLMALSFVYLMRINETYEERLLTTYGEVKEKESSLSEAYEHLKKSDHALRENTIALKAEIETRKQTEAELIEAKERAEESALAKSQFLSNMSHEIRTPLNAVVGLSNLMDQDNLTQEQKDNLDILRFSAENLMNIINDVLDFSKIDAGKIELEQTEVRFKQFVHRMVKSLELKANEKGVKLIGLVDDNVPDVVLGDPVRLSQIFTNLIGNAVKFTEEGSITVSVKLKKQKGGKGHIYAEVRDTGIGIAEDKQQLIFDSFSQANSETTRKYGGTGLGLAITKKLLELYGADLNLDSKPGEGSCFYFTILMDIPKIITGGNEVDISEITFEGLEGKKVLLVEDNLVNQKIATKFLEKWGLEVDVACDGCVAVEKVELGSFDIILMDLQMPKMDGYEAASKIRAMKGAEGKVPIIALTASAMLEIRQRAYDAGMNDYVSKPFNPNELFRKIATHVA